MQDQKIENLLNLALSVPEEERMRSEELRVGYDEAEKRWTIIVRYSGNLAIYASEQIEINELSGGYAIVRLPEDKVEEFAGLPEVEYVEKPRRLYYSASRGRSVSCIDPLQVGMNGLYGAGVLVAVIDSGVDYTHEDFRYPDGSSRILRIWDQTLEGEPPAGYSFGREFRKEDIDQALSSGGSLPTVDGSGHGTAVLGIAAGNGRASGGRYRGVAPASEILAVKLGLPEPESFPRTTELMTALDYVIRTARELGRPVAVNMSFGNTYGSHEGNSLVETFIDDMADQWKNSILVGTGNEADAGGHTSGRLAQGEVTEIPLTIGDGETALSVQLWKSYTDEFDVLLITPWGKVLGPVRRIQDIQEYDLEQVRILVYYGEPAPYSNAQEIYWDFLSKGGTIDRGVWTFRLVPRRIVTGEYDLWLPSSQARNQGTRFLYPTPETTLTIPSAASRVIAVGAYDGRNDAYAPFSGRGYTRVTGRIRPDLVAPGVYVTTTASGGGYAEQTGTSFAVPFVTGSAALLMEWGIIRGEDPYLYGEKIKAYLRRGARALSDAEPVPNPKTGYGALCLEESFPGEY